MNVLITGGTGFIGRKLVAALLARGTLPGAGGEERPIARLRVSDVAEPLAPLPDDARIETVYGDYTAPGAAAALVGEDTDAVFHLAAVVSGQAEQDFDLGLRINLDGTRMLLDACRAAPGTPRLVFTSSVAVFGGDMPEVIDDRTHLTPQTSYGSQKAACELLVNDYSRKGFVDGRALRLPTVVVRPGKPNAAASSFASAVIREPLQGDEYDCPVKPDTGVWILSPRRVVGALIHAMVLPAEAWGSYRAVSLPGMTLTVAEMVAAMREVAGERVAARVRYAPDPFIERIVYGWATRFHTPRALAMGFEADASFEEVVRAFIDDDLGGTHVA